MKTLGAHLRYIEGGRLRTTVDKLDGALVVGPADTVLGTMVGALIDPLRRHVCFLIVESGSWLMRQQYVLPLGTARFDRTRQALMVDVAADELRKVRVDQFQRFSDDDLIAAMFSPLAA